MTTARRSSPSRAAVLTALLTLAGIPRVALAQTPPTAEAPSAAVAAQARFDRGRELFQQGRFADALPEFRASLELFRSPNTRLYVGLCLQRMERFAESSAELSLTVSEADAMLATDRRYESARDLARRALAGTGSGGRTVTDSAAGAARSASSMEARPPAVSLTDCCEGRKPGASATTVTSAGS